MDFQSFYNWVAFMKKRGMGFTKPRLQIVLEIRRSGSDWLHGWHETDVWAADWALSAGQLAGRFGGGAAAIFFRAKKAHAGSAGNSGFLGDGFVAWNFFFDRLDHAALAAFGIAGGDDLLGDDVIAAGFHLACLGAVAGGLAVVAEQGAAGCEAK